MPSFNEAYPARRSSLAYDGSRHLTGLFNGALKDVRRIENDAFAQVSAVHCLSA
jgi:hypothetical protein